MWLKHVLRLTMCNKGLRKLLNCNSHIIVDKTCKVSGDIYASYTRTMMLKDVIDNKCNKISVTTEWAYDKLVTEKDYLRTNTLRLCK